MNSKMATFAICRAVTGLERHLVCVCGDGLVHEDVAAFELNEPGSEGGKAQTTINAVNIMNCHSSTYHFIRF